ncbi:MAG TPA: fibronectin type III domain-containing protein [Pyrinomonadaceae bacterium]|nr:fibronectin type III domain-containing protein [Pyrinomonadaceae bacterium]
MSKKQARRPTHPNGTPVRKRTRIIAIATVSLIATLTLGTVLGPWRDSQGARRLSAFFVAPFSPPPIPPPGSPSKEYIYAGGKLIATEESSPGPPPTNLVATAQSETSVNLTWTAPISGIATGYLIERRHSLSAQPVEIQTGVTTPSFTDATATANTAYLYRVRAIVTGGTSLYSNQDLATTVAFTNSELQGVFIKAEHLNQARRAVNAVRALSVPALGLAAWTYPDPVSSPAAQQRSIYLEDMRELRTYLNPALLALQKTALPDDPTLERGLPVKAAHIQDVRDQVK